MSGGVPGLLFDEHVNFTACQQLRARGMDVVHAVDAGLAGVPDPEILHWAIETERVVVTRNYHDFAPLVQGLAAQGIPFPGVLFLATSIRQNDVGAHVHAVEKWSAAFAAGDTSVTNGFGWLV